MTERLQGACLLLLAAVLVALCYGTGLGNGFVWLDHLEILRGSLVVREWGEIPGLFLDDKNFVGYHRPFYGLMHSFDLAVWGEDAFGFHLSSLVLHVTNVTGVFMLLRLLGKRALFAFAVASLWGLHPVNTAAVGLIHAKADLLVTTALLATSLALVRGWMREAQRVLWWGAAFAFFAVALFTKELAFIFPIAVFAVAQCHSGAGVARLRGVAVGMFCLAGAVALQRFFFQESGAYTSPLGLSERLLTFAGVYGSYVRQLVLPLDLSVGDTVLRFGALTTLGQVRHLTLFVMLVGAQVLLWRRWPELRAWITLFNLALLPVAQVVPVLHFRADRFLYLPSLAFAGLVVTGVPLFLRAGERSARWVSVRVGGCALCVLLALEAVAVVGRLPDFRSDLTLFEAELTRTRDYSEGWAHLGRYYEQNGDLVQAEQCYRIALMPRPHVVSYLPGALVVNLSNNLITQRKPGQALEVIAAHGKLVAVAEERDHLRYNEGLANLELGNFEAALSSFSSYAMRNPEDARCQFLIGVSARGLGRAGVAREAFGDYLRLDPDAQDRALVEQFLSEL